MIKSSSNYKKSAKRKHVNNWEWFDGECLKHKKKAKKSLKEFRTSRTVDNLNKYILNKKTYKSLCNDKKRFYELNCINVMENSIHISRNFWKEIRRFTNKSKVSNNIHLEEWYHYFRSLFTTDNLIERNNETEEQILF